MSRQLEIGDASSSCEGNTGSDLIRYAKCIDLYMLLEGDFRQWMSEEDKKFFCEFILYLNKNEVLKKFLCKVKSIFQLVMYECLRQNVHRDKDENRYKKIELIMSEFRLDILIAFQMMSGHVTPLNIKHLKKLIEALMSPNSILFNGMVSSDYDDFLSSLYEKHESTIDSYVEHFKTLGFEAAVDNLLCAPNNKSFTQCLRENDNFGPFLRVKKGWSVIALCNSPIERSDQPIDASNLPIKSLVISERVKQEFESLQHLLDICYIDLVVAYLHAVNEQVEPSEFIRMTVIEPWQNIIKNSQELNKPRTPLINLKYAIRIVSAAKKFIGILNVKEEIRDLLNARSEGIVTFGGTLYLTSDPLLFRDQRLQQFNSPLYPNVTTSSIFTPPQTSVSTEDPDKHTQISIRPT